jgi:hypothetical protein
MRNDFASARSHQTFQSSSTREVPIGYRRAVVAFSVDGTRSLATDKILPNVNYFTAVVPFLNYPNRP